MSATRKILIATLLLINLAGCVDTKNVDDPYEKFNRGSFAFNTKLDKAIVRPVAKAYTKVVPQYAQARVTNFFSNLDQIPTVANDALQLNLHQTLTDSSRFIVNSTVGILGLYDVASKINLPPHHNDLGLTFARWGMDKSPYIVIPFFGPSTARDTYGDVGDIYLSVWPYINNDWITYPAYALEKINQRAALLPADKLVDTAFDPYEFVRNAYLQKRTNQIAQLTQTRTASQDTFVANATGSGTTTQDNKDTFVPAGNETNGNNQDTFVPAGDEPTPTSQENKALPAPKNNNTSLQTSSNEPSSKKK